MKACVIDNGTGFTKLGYAGNYEPMMFRSTVATPDKASKKKALSDLDFDVGVETGTVGYDVKNPIQHGLIEDWDMMEKLWTRCIYQYLRCDPEDHDFCLTEPPLNPPENREMTAEIMFETFQVNGLTIQTQANMALMTYKLTRQLEGNSLTGCVIDSGDGVTHVIPVVDGYVIGSCLKHIPLAGSDITKFIFELQRDRGEKIPQAQRMATARRTKEQFCYAVPDIVKEFGKYDEKPADKFKKYTGLDNKGNPYTIDIGYERFLGPELFFNPSMFSNQFKTPLPTVVDQVIQDCPIDCRRKLYKSIVLSGGSSMFKNLDKRLKKDINTIVKARLAESERITGQAPTPIEVNVLSSKFQRHAVWCGASLAMASSANSKGCVRTRADYEEHGAWLFRQFSSAF